MAKIISNFSTPVWIMNFEKAERYCLHVQVLRQKTESLLKIPMEKEHIKRSLLILNTPESIVP